MNVFNSLVSRWPPHPPPCILFSTIFTKCSEHVAELQSQTVLYKWTLTWTCGGGGGGKSCLIMTFCARSSSCILTMQCLKSTGPKLYICSYKTKQKQTLSGWRTTKSWSGGWWDWITANIKQYDATKQTCWTCQVDGSTGQGRSGSLENYTVDICKSRLILEDVL